MKAKDGCLTGTNTDNTTIKSSKGMYYNYKGEFI